MATSKTCVVCNRPVRGLDRICQNTFCRHQFSLSDGNRRTICRVCGRPLRNVSQTNCGAACSNRLLELDAQAKKGVVGRCSVCGIYTSRRGSSGDWECGDSACETLRFLRVQVEQRQALEERRLRLHVKASQLRDSLLARDQAHLSAVDAPVLPSESGSANGLAQAGEGAAFDFESYRVVVVPHLTERMAEREEVRFEQLKEHIAVRVEAAFSEPETAWDTPYTIDQLPEATRPRELPLFVAGCSACRGKCCLQGEEHAFISTSTIRRYVSNHPDATAAEVLADYLEHVPARAIRGSCLYHTDRGCALPGEMRADMCNHYICPSLSEMRHALAEEGTSKFFIVAEHEGDLLNPSFVEASADVIENRPFE